MSMFNFVFAISSAVVSLIALVALLPVMSFFMPLIQTSFGTATWLMCSVMVLLLVIGLIWRMMAETQEQPIYN